MPARISLRPIATALPLGFLGLFVATLSFSAVQLGWIPPSEGRSVALAVLFLTVPVQIIASIFGFLARDPVAATGMGLLAGTWAGVALVTLGSAPGATSPGLGVVLLGAAASMLVPAAGGHAKTLAAAVMGLSALRFAVTGIAQIDGGKSWLAAAGWVGLVLALLSLYAALAFEVEAAEKRQVLPLWRRGAAADAVSGDADAQVAGLAREPGVRQQL